MTLPKKDTTPPPPKEEPTSSLHDFEDHLQGMDSHAPFEFSALGTAFNTVMTAVEQKKIPDYELRKLLDVLPNRQDTQDFGANFDLAEEITFQLQALTAVRENIFSQDGRIRDGKTIKDAKEFLTSSTSLLQLLQKSRNELINADRMQAMEEAIIETLNEQTDEIKEAFMSKFESRLEKIQ